VIKVDAPVRMVDAFVASLGLRQLGFTEAGPALEGRPPYDPADLLKRGGFEQMVRTSRRLQVSGGTIGPQSQKVCRWFVQFCRGPSRFGEELVATDESKFAAKNGPERPCGDAD